MKILSGSRGAELFRLKKDRSRFMDVLVEGNGKDRQTDRHMDRNSVPEKKEACLLAGSFILPVLPVGTFIL